MIRYCQLACLLAAATAASGCVAIVAGAAAAGTIQYVRNEAYRDYPATVEATWSATLASLQEHGLPVDPTATCGPRGRALNMNGVKVKVMYLGPAQTRVSVRVGTFDTNAHREKARLILDGVAAHLAPTPAEPVAAPE